jgi:predicted Rossmann fold nucleotide-binding protein DprA/Smf involved in DNA uptake
VAAAHQTIVSGGAKGIDQAAMRGALAVPGKVVGVLPDGLDSSALNREFRKPLLDKWLVLISPYDPGASFNVGHAMQRNKLIYALADAALVMNSDFDKGGTWAGATEQLEKLNCVRVYIRSTGDIGEGLKALRAKGAIPWPNPRDATELVAMLRTPAEVKLASRQDELPLGACDVKEPQMPSDGGQRPNPDAVGLAIPSLDEGSGPAREIFSKVREVVLRLLTRPMSASEVGAALELNAAQSAEWLERLVAEGVLERGGIEDYVVSSRTQEMSTSEIGP